MMWSLVCTLDEDKMAKDAVWTKWPWPNGVGSVEMMQDGMKGIKPTIQQKTLLSGT